MAPSPVRPLPEQPTLQTDDGNALIVRVLNLEQSAPLRCAFGLDTGSLPGASKVHEALPRRGAPFSLTNGWRLVRLLGAERLLGRFLRDMRSA